MYITIVQVHRFCRRNAYIIFLSVGIVLSFSLVDTISIAQRLNCKWQGCAGC